MDKTWSCQYSIIKIKDIKSKAVQTVKRKLELEKEQSPKKNVDIRKK